MAKILLIDDDADLRRFLQLTLEEHGHQVECLERAERAPEVLMAGTFDLVLLDNKMPGMTGIDFLGALKKRNLSIPVILMTGHATTDIAIQAMNLGAFDYVIKPSDLEELSRELEPLIAKALELAQPVKGVYLQGEPAPAGASGPVMLGTSKPMREVCKLIGKVAGSDAPVLIQGETGTGKELVARAIHGNSMRKGKPFVAMNCTALNENLLDDELFGHEPHAFTGADNKLRKGRFEYANGGTLFLDEVGDMPPTLQAKLLRVLENQEVYRIGSNEAIKVNVRLLSATHCDLGSAIHEGKFREDLFYRLAGVTIHLPPLRERGPDLQVLAEHFLTRAAVEMGRPAAAMHPTTLAKLQTYPWPGNIRQLQNVMRRAALVCRGGQILPSDLEFPVQETVVEDDVLAGLHRAIRWALNSGQGNLYPLLRDLLERELLKLALLELDGNQTQVAERLGMARGTVIDRTRKYGLK